MNSPVQEHNYTLAGLSQNIDNNRYPMYMNNFNFDIFNIERSTKIEEPVYTNQWNFEDYFSI